MKTEASSRRALGEGPTHTHTHTSGAPPVPPAGLTCRGRCQETPLAWRLRSSSRRRRPGRWRLQDLPFSGRLTRRSRALGALRGDKKAERGRALRTRRCKRSESPGSAWPCPALSGVSRASPSPGNPLLCFHAETQKPGGTFEDTPLTPVFLLELELFNRLPIDIMPISQWMLETTDNRERDTPRAVSPRWGAQVSWLRSPSLGVTIPLLEKGRDWMNSRGSLP